MNDEQLDRWRTYPAYNEACATCGVPADLHKLPADAPSGSPHSLWGDVDTCRVFVRSRPPRAAYGSLDHAPDIIYLVLTGESSDTTVEAAYLEPDPAQRMAEACGGRVDCVPIGRHLDKLALGLRPFMVAIAYDLTRAWPEMPDDRNAPDAYVLPFSTKSVLVSCWATDRAHAVGIAADLRAQWVAAGSPYVSYPWQPSKSDRKPAGV